MKTFLTSLAAGSLLCLATPELTAADATRHIKLSEASAAAQATIKEEIAGGKIQQISRTTEVGYNSLEVDYVKGGVEHSFTVSSLGKLLDRQITITDVPAPAQKTIRAQAAGGKVGDITWVNDEGDVFYYVEFDKGGKKHAVSIDADGKLLSEQVALEETPAVVQKAIKNKVGDGKIEDIDKSDDDGDISFDVTFTKGTSKRSFTVDEDGDLISEQVARNEMTEVVQKTIKDKVGKDRFKRLDKVVEDEEPYYQIEVIRGGKKTAFKVAMDGKFLGTAD